jgi:hypothetical protein
MRIKGFLLLIPLFLGCYLSFKIGQESASQEGRFRIIGAALIATIHGGLLFIGYNLAFVGFETNSFFSVYNIPGCRLVHYGCRGSRGNRTFHSCSIRVQKKKY